MVQEEEEIEYLLRKILEMEIEVNQPTAFLYSDGTNWTGVNPPKVYIV